MALFSLLITACVAVQGIKTQCSFYGMPSRSYPSEATCQKEAQAAASRTKVTLLKQYPTASLFIKGDCFLPEVYPSVLLGIPDFAQMLDADYTFTKEYVE